MKKYKIKPRETFKAFLKFAREHTITFFSNKNEFGYIGCSEYGNTNSTFQLTENTDASAQERFQQFLRNDDLSSHMCIISQKV